MARIGQTLIRARAAVAGMQPGQVDWRPTERADALIKGGYAVKVESLAERQASEPPNRHLDRRPITWSEPDPASHGAFIPTSDRNPIPGPVDLTEPS
jgi:hypothetical protein